MRRTPGYSLVGCCFTSRRLRWVTKASVNPIALQNNANPGVIPRRVRHLESCDAKGRRRGIPERWSIDDLDGLVHFPQHAHRSHASSLGGHATLHARAILGCIQRHVQGSTIPRRRHTHRSGAPAGVLACIELAGQVVGIDSPSVKLHSHAAVSNIDADLVDSRLSFQDCPDPNGSPGRSVQSSHGEVDLMVRLRERRLMTLKSPPGDDGQHQEDSRRADELRCGSVGH